MTEREYLASYFAAHFPSYKESKACADTLMGRFCNIEHIMVQKYKELEKIAGAPAASTLKLIADITSRRFTESIKMPKKYTEAEIMDIAAWIYFGKETEFITLMFFDKDHRLVSIEKLRDGTVSRSEIIPTDILAATVKSKAVYAAMAHNHPSGDAVASASDVSATTLVKRVLATVNVELLRHYVIAANHAEIIDAREMY